MVRETVVSHNVCYGKLSSLVVLIPWRVCVSLADYSVSGQLSRSTYCRAEKNLLSRNKVSGNLQL